MNYKKYFSERLTDLRKQRKISQKALGEIIGITDAAVTMMERAKRAPSFEVLCAIADYFNVSVDYLVGRTDNPEINV